MKPPPSKNDATPLAGEVGVNESNLHFKHIEPNHLQPLADDLGVTADRFGAIGLPRSEGEYRFPERNSNGRSLILDMVGRSRAPEKPAEAACQSDAREGGAA